MSGRGTGFGRPRPPGLRLGHKKMPAGASGCRPGARCRGLRIFFGHLFSRSFQTKVQGTLYHSRSPTRSWPSVEHIHLTGVVVDTVRPRTPHHAPYACTHRMQLSSPQLHEALGQTVRGSSKARFGGLPEDAEHATHHAMHAPCGGNLDPWHRGAPWRGGSANGTTDERRRRLTAIPGAC